MKRILFLMILFIAFGINQGIAQRQATDLEKAISLQLDKNEANKATSPVTKGKRNSKPVAEKDAANKEILVNPIRPPKPPSPHHALR